MSHASQSGPQSIVWQTAGVVMVNSKVRHLNPCNVAVDTHKVGEGTLKATSNREVHFAFFNVPELYSGVAIKMSFLNSQWEKFQWCQLWKPFENSKIDILPWIFLPQHHLYVINTCTKFQGHKIYQKRDIQNLPTCVHVKKNSLLPTLTVFQRLIFFFDNFFLSWDHIYVDNMCAKFQIRKIYTKKDIRNLPTCGVVRKNFTTISFDILPRGEKLFFCHENFGMSPSLCW